MSAYMPFRIIWAESERDMDKGQGQVALTATQVAARLGVSERRVRGLFEEAKLTPCPEKFWNSPLYLESDVETLRQQRMKSHF